MLRCYSPLSFILLPPPRRAIPLAGSGRLASIGLSLLSEKFLACSLFGYDIGGFVGHGPSSTSITVAPPAWPAFVIDYFAGASSHFGGADDAACFQEIDQAGGTGVTDAEAALQEGDGSSLVLTDNLLCLL